MSAPSTFTAPTDPGPLIAGIPLLLGFHPASSAVAVVIDDDRIGLTARLDLPERDESFDWFTSVAETIAQNFTDPEVHLVFYPAHEADLTFPVTTATVALTRVGIAVADRLATDGQTWWSLSAAAGPEQHMLPSAVQSITPEDRDTAIDLIGDRPVAPSREDLVAEFTAGPKPARARVARLLAALPPVQEEDRDTLIEEFARTVATATEPSEAVAAMLIKGLADVPIRDTVLWDVLQSDLPAQQHACALLAHLASLAPDDHLAGPATLLAVLRFLGGDGARALIALERVQDVDPDYTLSHLLATVILGGIPPYVWREHMQTLPREMCRQAPPEA